MWSPRLLLPRLTVLFSGTVAFAAPVTFTRDVAPILRERCEGCHRPGEAAPMSFRTYQEARPWAAAIGEAVALRKMPPWFADPNYGHFTNDRSLKRSEIETLVTWAKTGALEGDPKISIPRADYLDGWNIGQPDVQVEMPAAFKVPATGTVGYQRFVIPLEWKQDTWVQQAEIRPGNRALVHHANLFVEPRSGGPAKEEDLILGYAPGMPSLNLPSGRAKLIKAGSHLILQMHYTPNGKEGFDRTKIGFVFAKGPVTERVVSLSAQTQNFEIPPNDPDYRVDAVFEFAEAAKVISLQPHMHLRGKSFLFRAVYPTGESETLLSVPHYEFGWQLTYFPVKELNVPKGTRIECTARYDNSANNPANPDPTKVVRYGQQSFDEMMYGVFDVAIDVHRDPASLIAAKR